MEEIKQPYELKKYYRDSITHLAPESLKVIHPLGKSPIIEWNEKIIIESGAIVELLSLQLASQLAPEIEASDYIDYFQIISTIFRLYRLFIVDSFFRKFGNDALLSKNV